MAFFSTGDELVSIGTQLGEGQIFDSNRYTIHGMLTRLGCEVLDMGVVRDDPRLLEKAFQDAAAAADVVITSGGVSVGEADFVKDLLDKLGEVVFWKIAMKPGRPLAYGKIGTAHFFGLPGNPVSVMVTFYQFVRDALLKLSGRDPVPVLSDIQGSVRLQPQEGTGTHGISAWRAGTRFARNLERARDRRAGLRHPALDVGSQLLHHPPHRAGQRHPGHSG